MWCHGMKCTNDNLITDKKADKFSNLRQMAKETGTQICVLQISSFTNMSAFAQKVGKLNPNKIV